MSKSPTEQIRSVAASLAGLLVPPEVAIESEATSRPGKKHQPKRPTYRASAVTIATTLSLFAMAIQPVAASSGLAPTAGSPFTSITGFVSDVPSNGTFGPMGLLDDGSHFYISDYANSTMYRFPVSGGSATSPEVSATNGINSGLALALGVYYGTAQPFGTPLASGLYTFDPNTLALGNQVATFPGAFFIRQVVVDPRNGHHLYVSTDVGIFLVDTSSSPAAVLSFGPAGDYDGMEFTSDGNMLYVAAAAGSTVYGFDRTGNQQLVANLCCGTDGLAVAQPNTILGNGVDVSNNIFVNMNDGTIQRIDVNNGNQVTTVASGGSRGDFVAVGPDGTLYATQTDDVLKLEPAIFQTQDTTPPVISIVTPAQGAAYALNQIVVASYTCKDPDSTSVTCVGSVPNGSTISTSSLGSKSFTVNGADQAGNSASATALYSVGFSICYLYDQTKAVQSGAVVPIKVELCDATGTDASSSAIVVTATGVTKVSSSAPGTLESPGNSNPDNNFRFDSTLGTSGGYIFNLSSSGLSTGTYALSFTAAGDPTVHTAQFQVK